jgi:hypothetical protein
MSHAAPITVNREAELNATKGVGSGGFVRPPEPKFKCFKVGCIEPVYVVYRKVLDGSPVLSACKHHQDLLATKLKWQIKPLKNILHAPCPENREPLTDRDFSLSNFPKLAARRPNE